MNIKKKIIGNLDKCYSIAMLDYNNASHILVAAEKINKCLLFDIEGNFEDTVWEQPGGTMSMVQVPGTNGHFLATHRFYSPNDGKNSSIVYVKPTSNGNWDIRTMIELPFVHRFDIVTRNGWSYLIACTIKSDHRFKDDWSSPGKIYFTVLPEDLDLFLTEQQALDMKILKDGLTKNHGYYRLNNGEHDYSIISCNDGIYKITPPPAPNYPWGIETLLAISASDAILFDIDNDGEQELFVLSPFHGDTLSIYKRHGGKFVEYYRHLAPLKFLHALYAGELCGKPSFVLGYRGDERKLLIFTANSKGGFDIREVDSDCGPANIMKFHHKDKDYIISTNREINEIALYEFD